MFCPILICFALDQLFHWLFTYVSHDQGYQELLALNVPGSIDIDIIFGCTSVFGNMAFIDALTDDEPFGFSVFHVDTSLRVLEHNTPLMSTFWTSLRGVITMSNVFRMNLNTSANEQVNTMDFCLKRGIVGIGWALSEQSTSDWEEYKKLAELEYATEKNEHSKAFHAAVSSFERMKQGDIIWVSGTNGRLYLGEIQGEIICNYGKNYVMADVVSMRKCKLLYWGQYSELPINMNTLSVVPLGTISGIENRDVIDWTLEQYNKLFKQH